MTTLIVTAPVEKVCPYRDEVDHGTVTLTFDVLDGEDGPELHRIAAYLGDFEGQKLSHEDFTRIVARLLGATTARSTWRTAGMEVVVSVECNA